MVCDLLEKNLVWLLESHVYSHRYELVELSIDQNTISYFCLHEGVVWILALAYLIPSIELLTFHSYIKVTSLLVFI